MTNPNRPLVASLLASAVVLSIAAIDMLAQDEGGLDTRLYQAASQGEPGRIAELVAAGARVDAVIPGDGSALIGAARQGHLAAVDALLERGADVNLAVKGDGSPLIAAARGGHADVVARLIERGAAIDLVVPDDENALIQASAHGRLAIARLLVGRGADVNARTWAERDGKDGAGEWRTALAMARRGGHTDVAAYLVTAGARE